MDYGRATECMMFGPCSAGRDLEFDLFVNVRNFYVSFFEWNLRNCVEKEKKMVRHN
jgi:hypothetical protein